MAKRRNRNSNGRPARNRLPAEKATEIKRLTEVESLRVEAAQLRLELANKDLAAIISHVKGVQNGDGLTRLDDGTWALVRGAKADVAKPEAPG